MGCRYVKKNKRQKNGVGRKVQNRMKPLYFTQNVDLLYDYEHKINMSTHVYLFNARCKVSHNEVASGSFHPQVYIEKCNGWLKYARGQMRKNDESENVDDSEIIMLPAHAVDLNLETLIHEVTNMFQRGHTRGEESCKCCKKWSNRQKKIFSFCSDRHDLCCVEPKLRFSDSDILQEIGCKSMDAEIESKCISDILSTHGFKHM
jgi:hypothetical protein